MMASIFKNPLVVLENVVGSLLDRRDVILWEQPQINTSSLLSSTEGTLPVNIGQFVNSQLSDMIEQSLLTELFTGLSIPGLSKLNGFNMYGVSYLSATVTPTSDICEHPLESGAKIAEYAILEPLQATVRIAMPTHRYRQIFNQITELYKNKTYIILQTKYGFYKNMVLESMPHDLDYKDIDRTPIELKLRQVLEVYPTYISDKAVAIKENQARNASDADTRDVGLAKTEDTFQSIAAIGV